LLYRNVVWDLAMMPAARLTPVAKLLGLGYPGGPILDRLRLAAGGVAAPGKFATTKTRGMR